MISLIDNLTEPYRQSIQASYDHFISSNFEHKSTGEFVLFTFATVIFYWILGLLYLFIDLTERPKFLAKFKTQPGVSQITTQKLYQLIRQVLFNQLLTLAVAYPLILLKYKYTNVQTEIPTLSRFVYEFVVFLLFTEVLFYYCHRALHHSSVYKYFHKVHHEWQTAIAIEAVYAHLLEHLLLSFVLALVGPILLNSHTLTIVLWFAMVAGLNEMDHSGYDFPFIPFPTVFHDFHHLKFNSNYSLLGLMDWLHGTDAIFRQSTYYKKKRIYKNLKII